MTTEPSRPGVRPSANHELLAANSQQQSFYNNSLTIRQEIQRFESVHPSIYAVYDLLDLVPEPLAQQIREHVVCIEDSFVNSQEWTLSKSVPDLRLGIVGSLSSGKSALVHRYLTGSYMQDESPEGGRFKKEILLDGQSYLLLIRDEGGAPEMQFSCWVDAVIFVFSLNDEASFAAVQGYFAKMSNFRNSHDVPIILVGTRESIRDNSRVIDEARAKKLASEMRKCSYYETSALNGSNVEQVFKEACQKIIQGKSIITNAPVRPNTPSSTGIYRQQNSTSTVTNNSVKSPSHSNQSAVMRYASPQLSNRISAPPMIGLKSYTNSEVSTTPRLPARSEMKNFDTPAKCSERAIDVGSPQSFLTPLAPTSSKDLPTPVSTPTTARKQKRRSNIFPHLTTSKHKNLEEKNKNGELGSGRTIPVRQGLLYKKSQKSLNKDWKKKYVTLTTDGRLTYHPTLHDYMNDVHGKDIPLKHTTVKVPGLRFRQSKPSGNPSALSDLSSDLANVAIGTSNGTGTKLIPSTNPLLAKDKAAVKKRHRRHKSISKNDGFEDFEGFEFTVVSLENKQWQFEAESVAEREAWVSAIEQQILNSLQGMESDKSRLHAGNSADKATVQAIRTVSGNSRCVDCDASNPDWASLNLGALICIECSGIHRNLGTHISRVRSLDLDDWPSSHVSVLMELGNASCNKIWEGNTCNKKKPTVDSSRDEKERWIRAKYEHKEFLAPLKGKPPMKLEQQLLDAVTKNDVFAVAHVLAHGANVHQSNTSCRTNVDLKTPLHIAASKSNLALCQLLIWSNADVKAIDVDGRTALFYARNNKDIEDLLRQNGCTETSVKQTKDMHPVRLTPRSEVFDKLPSSVI